MKFKFYKTLSGFVAALVAVGLIVLMAGPSLAQSSGVSFGKSLLQNETSGRPTSLVFGPDGRLYVAQQNGSIKVYTVQRRGANDYAVTASETIDLVKNIPNHNDDGSLNTIETNRQVLGLVVTGTANNPILYASSSDPRIGAGSGGTDTNLDTNSGIVSRLTWDGTKWSKVDLVRGLPRSEENHSVNGLQLSPDGKKLYLAVGGNTNKGATSNNFALLPEFALSAAILQIDLEAIGNSTYDLPTLNDEDRSGNPDTGDPFGGNDGKNQAKLVPGGPVQVHASGFRNPYDLVVTEAGRMYTIDNGGNAGWGDFPVGEGPAGACTNALNEPGTTDEDSLHHVNGAGYYGGHPNPTRANPANTFNASNPQSPVSAANPIECDYRANGADKGSLTTFPNSTNGIDEYTASNFGGAMKGDLIAASFGNQIYRLTPDATGDAVTKEQLFSSVGAAPLDVIAQGDEGPFPGTMWVADIGSGNIVVFEPADGGGSSCGATDDPALDDDSDGFDNADELDNGTSPCSAGDTPSDNDGDRDSDLNDPDDDNDTRPDTSDPFAVDAQNGKATNLPVNYTWDNEESDATNPGGLLDLGFTGLMTNKSSDYRNLYDATNMTAGGAAGAVTVDKVNGGDAKGTDNDQQYGLQFGVNATQTTGLFTAHTRIAAPFSGMTPQDFQSMGLFIGNGDQDNYAKIVTMANGGVGGLQFAREINGAFSSNKATATMPGPDYVDLYLKVDPAASTVQPSYQIATNGVRGARTNLGGVKSIPASWFGGQTGLAVGIISTSKGDGPEFPATWNFIEVAPGDLVPAPPGDWKPLAPNSKNRQEVSYAQAGGRFYLAGGQNTLHERYSPASNSWEKVEPLPAALENIQSVELNGKIYYIGGLVDWPEPHADTVYVYDPATDTFTEGEPMPADRARGAGGAAAYNGKIYYAGGMHDGVAVPWVDVYDPAADTWSRLPDMPRSRDHFHAEVVDGKLYAIGGRATEINTLTNKVDVYDLAAGAGGTWETRDTVLPTPRGGFATAVLGKEILVIGGEGFGTTYDAVEAYDTVNNTWRTMEPMVTPRHGIQAATCNGGVYVAAGGKTQGGATPSNVHEAFFLNGTTTCQAPAGDTLPPLAQPPEQTFVTGKALGTSTVPVKVKWSAATDGGSGVAAYELQEKLNGGSYANVKLASATATFIDRSLNPGDTVRYRLRARDAAGNTSGWKYGSSFTVVPFQETDSAVQYGGTWGMQNASSAFGGAMKYASTSGNSAKVTFTGRDIAWVAYKGPDRGKAEVWLDGVNVATVDLYNAKMQVRKIAYSTEWGFLGTHTLEVRPLGTKNASSSGTRVDVDAFVSLGQDETAPTVNDVTPSDGATEVPLAANATATFAEAMDAETLTASTFKLTEQGGTAPVAAAVSYDAATRKATLNPGADLEPGATYTATVKGGTRGARDIAGNPLAADKVWSFTTFAPDTAAPETTIDAATPSGGSATFEFSSSEANSTFECSLDGAAFGVCSSPQQYTGLADGSHNFQVRAVDGVGNADTTPAGHTWKVDTTAPTVSSVAPANLATEVALGANVEASFSEEMDPLTVDGTTFALTGPGGTAPVAATVAYDAPSQKATLDPEADLDPGTTYTATVAGGVEDAAGNALGTNETWSFVTTLGVTTEPPAGASSSERGDDTTLRIGGLRPAGDSTTENRRPAIRAKVTDAKSNLAKADISLFIDGEEIPRSDFAYDRRTDRLRYEPREKLSFGEHTVKIVARGQGGGVEREDWAFGVVRS